MFLPKCVEALAEGFAGFGERRRGLRGVDLFQPRRPAGQRHDIVVERAVMDKVVFRARIVTVHDSGPSAESAGCHATANIFAKRRHIGGDAERALPPIGAEPRCHHFVEYQQRAIARRPLAQQRNEMRIGGNAAASTLKELHQNGRQVFAMFVE